MNIKIVKIRFALVACILLFNHQNLMAQLEWTKYEVFEKKGLYGFREWSTKNVGIEPKFEYARKFENRPYTVVGKDCQKVAKKAYLVCKKYAIINSKGDLMTDYKYDKIEFGRDDRREMRLKNPISIRAYQLARVTVEGKMGLFNLESGKEILPPVAINIMGEQDMGFGVDVFASGKLVIYQLDNNKWGMMDIEGKELLKPEQDYIRPIPYSYKDSRTDYTAVFYAIYKKDNKYGVAYYDGVVIPPDYDEILGYDKYKTERNRRDLTRWIVPVQNQKYGLIDRNGYSLIPCELDSPAPNPDLTQIKYKNGFYGVSDFYGNLIVPYEYEYIIDYAYDKILSPNCKVYAVKKDGKYGAVDASGNELIKPFADTVYTYMNKHSLIFRDNKSFRDSKEAIDINFYKDSCKVGRVYNPNVNTNANIKTDYTSQYNTKSEECLCCDGKGFKKDYNKAEYVTCYQCGGSGHFGYEYKSTATGRDKSRWYGGPGYSPQTCTVCKGSRKVFSQHVQTTCSCCKGTGKTE